MAGRDLERFALDLEHKYGLIAEGKTIDTRTATVREPNLVTTVNANGNSKLNGKAVLAAATEDASNS